MNQRFSVEKKVKLSYPEEPTSYSRKMYHAQLRKLLPGAMYPTDPLGPTKLVEPPMLE